MKTLGVIGGMGWEATLVYYRVINQRVRERLGGLHSARLILDSFDFAPIALARTPHEYDEVRRLLVASARRLETAGADGILVACNTVHRFAQAMSGAISVPLLHVADAAGRALRADGHERVGLLGTLATMRGGVYTKRLEGGHGLQVRVPSAATCTLLQTLIVEELAVGNFHAEQASRLDAAVEELARDGCTAVVLGCTELGLTYGSLDQPVLHRALPLYDTAVLHAHAAVEFALGDGDQPG
jgi:aspartate racemase